LGFSGRSIFGGGVDSVSLLVRKAGRVPLLLSLTDLMEVISLSVRFPVEKLDAIAGDFGDGGTGSGGGVSKDDKLLVCL
jgi:hypothetical protein